MMRKMKKYLLMYLTLLICITGFSVQISADDEESAVDQTYAADYEFVMDDGSEVPECVLELLPEKLTGLKPGDVVTNEPLKDVETEESVFSFDSWNYDEYTIEDSDVTFTAIWSMKKNESPSDIKETEKPNEQPDDESGTYTVLFDFVLLGNLKGNNLPDEVMKLVPQSMKVRDGSRFSYPKLESESTGDYVFDHWEPGYVKGNGDVVYFGVWKPESMSGISLMSIPRPDRPADAKTGESYQIPIQGTAHSNARHQFLDNAGDGDFDDAFCVEIDVTGYANPTHSYWIIGRISSRIAEIIWLGLGHGGRPTHTYDAIQCAIWNYQTGYIKYTLPSGENVDPDSWDYNGSGSYECWGDLYESYVTDTGAVQNLTKKGSVGCKIKSGSAKVKKEASDSNYPYKSYSNNYSLAGAVYGFYSDPECTDLKYQLTTDANGNTKALEFNSARTLYVKEISPSKGFNLDPNVYTARITLGNTTVITSKEDPFNDPVRIVLIKQNARHPERVAYLDEAEFTVKYYDTQEDDVSGMAAKKTWVFRPIYNENGEAEILMDSQHYVRGDDLVLNEYGDFYLPLGTFTIQETKAPQTYQIDPNVYVGHISRVDDQTVTTINGGDQLLVENLDLTQKEREVIIRTTAIFEENGLHRYFADGVAHIVDIVDYDSLSPGEEYTLKAKLILKTFEEILWTREDYDSGDCTEEQIGTVKERILKEDECKEIMEAEATFVPENESGQASVRFDGIDFDDKAGNEYVVYEYLYLSSDLENMITYHEDINDKGQTVNIDELYRADFILYKIGNGNKSVRLNGAYFDVKTSRTKRDGRVIEKQLGTFVTGGIYLEREEPFKVTVYEDEACTTSIKQYESKWDSRFRKDVVTILDLEEGTYYLKVEGEDEVSVHQVAKGMIFLPMQEEDTQITFTELIAPQGYYLDRKPFVMTVGHDYELLKVENYRSNSMIIIPNTGYDGQ